MKAAHQYTGYGELKQHLARPPKGKDEDEEMRSEEDDEDPDKEQPRGGCLQMWLGGRGGRAFGQKNTRGLALRRDLPRKRILNQVRSMRTKMRIQNPTKKKVPKLMNSTLRTKSIIIIVTVGWLVSMSTLAGPLEAAKRPPLSFSMPAKFVRY